MLWRKQKAIKINRINYCNVYKNCGGKIQKLKWAWSKYHGTQIKERWSDGEKNKLSCKIKRNIKRSTWRNEIRNFKQKFTIYDNVRRGHEK